MKFKQWLEEEEGFTQPDNSGNERLSINLANRAVKSNPQFATNMAMAPNPKEKMNLVGKMTSDVMKHNKNAIKSSGIKPGVVSNQIAKAGGMEDYKGQFMKKGMKKK